MANVKRGRKPLPKGQNLVPVRVFVKEVNFKKALAEIAAIANKYKK